MMCRMIHFAPPRTPLHCAVSSIVPRLIHQREIHPQNPPHHQRRILTGTLPSFTRLHDDIPDTNLPQGTLPQNNTTQRVFPIAHVLHRNLHPKILLKYSLNTKNMIREGDLRHRLGDHHSSFTTATRLVRTIVVNPKTSSIRAHTVPQHSNDLLPSSHEEMVIVIQIHTNDHTRDLDIFETKLVILTVTSKILAITRRVTFQQANMCLLQEVLALRNVSSGYEGSS
mmetsp:Transcript_7422/g.27742  ORF Transcript_7422/g.27742 Transcript_7422/m.27742 type:complete len:226 (-) Transcript_7422:2626-3303(-)